MAEPDAHATTTTETELFKELMSGFPSGVAVVTTLGPDGAPKGMTCTSLCSVTTDPPTLTVCLHSASGTLAAVQARGRFAVNLLHERGRPAAELFASGRLDRFTQLSWTADPDSALPHLEDHSHAIAECRLKDIQVAMGDHTMLFGEVESVATGGGAPLLYGRRRFARWSGTAPPPPNVVHLDLPAQASPVATHAPPAPEYGAPATTPDGPSTTTDMTADPANADAEGVIPPDPQTCADDDRPSYKGLLELDRLLRLQREPVQHDQLMFIVVHQVHELWFKLMLHELDEARDLVRNDRIEAAVHVVRRLRTVQTVMVSHWSVLDTMLPGDFLSFRDDLQGGSGFESVQFREIEFAGGLKDESYLERARLDDDERLRLRRRLDEPSLRELFLDAVLRRGYGSLSELCGRRYRDDDGSGLLRLAEGLIDFDQAFAEWRARHTLSVERQIGHKVGTAGSSGVDYLRAQLTARLFPELWQVRAEL